MGIAAYNRGSKAISDRLNQDLRPREFEIMDILNNLPKYPDAGTPFQTIHFDFVGGQCWAICPVTGFGFCYPTLHEAVKRWRVEIVGMQNGVYIAEPLPREGLK